MKRLIKKIVPNSIIKFLKGSKFRNKTPEQVFNYIYSQRHWNKEGESVSGSGSELAQTKLISEKLPKIFAKYDVNSILDIPCGDLNWMRNVLEQCESIQYTGADIVEELINTNQLKFAKDRITFKKINLIDGELPTVDMVFCRDCLVHLSFQDIHHSLKNICASNSKYLLTTTFVDLDRNVDIHTGNHRCLNLQLPPFNFPSPLEILCEKEEGYIGSSKDKCLGLWEVDVLRAVVSS